MRHTKWIVLAAFAAASLQGCAGCDDTNIRNANGLGRIIEKGSSGERNEVEETTVDFGAVVLDTRAERKILIRNQGSSSMSIYEVQKSDGFPETFNTDIPTFTLDAQTEKEVSVYFEPKVVGEYSGTITLLLDGADNEQLVIHLKARSIEGGCTISVAGDPTNTPIETADFGSVALGTSYVMMIRIANASEVDWDVNVAAIIEDADKGVFVFNNFSPGLTTVRAHGEILVPIEFKPNHVGVHTATLSIPSPSMCQPGVLPLTGTGVEDVLECEPKVLVTDSETGQERWECLLDFGFVNPNNKAVAEVTFKNLGNTEIQISGFTLVQDATKGDTFDVEKGADGTDYKVAGVTVKKGESVKVPVSFLPTLLGLHKGRLDFVSTDAKRASGYFTLQGTGGGPAIETSPSERIDFGPVAVGTYQHRRLTITNVGTDIQGTTDDNLRLMEPDPTTSCVQNTACASGVCQRGNCWVEKKAIIEVVTGDPSEFSLLWPPEGYQDTGIAAAGSADLKVKFSPLDEGAKEARVTVYSNDPAKPAVVLTVVGSGAAFPPCEYDVIPPQLSFGNVEVGRNLELSFNIRNKATDPADQCLISTLGFTRGTSSDFTLVDGPLNGVTIPGGTTLEVPVRFTPKKDGTYTGAVEFYISSVSAPEGQVTMTGSAQKGYLLVAPNELDFGVIEVGCNSRNRTFTIYNVSSASQKITSIELQQGLSTEFHIVSIPLLPYTLAAGESVDFQVKYSPTDVGEDQGSIAVTTASLAQPYVIPVTGRGDNVAMQTDIFAQDPQPKVDVLFIVDNSGSMSDEQSNLGGNFDSFIKFALAQGVDYHIGVTTTGVDEAHGGLNDNYGDADENGCIVPINGSNPKVITPQTPNAEQVFKQNVNVGTDGNYSELLIRPAYLALTSPNVTGCNAGFLRDDANLAVVVVSDAGDQDTLPVSFYLNAMFTIKGYKRQNMFSFSGILLRDESEASCVSGGDGSEQFIPRVEQMVNATAGVIGDICDASWNTTLEKLGQNAFGYRTRFFLTNTPDTQKDIVVKVDGKVYSATGPYGDVRWNYNSVAVAIDFSALAVPEPGSTIEVIYYVACL